MRGHAEPHDHAGVHETSDLAVDRPRLSVQDEYRLARGRNHVPAKDAALDDRPVRVAPLGETQRHRLADTGYHLYFAWNKNNFMD